MLDLGHVELFFHPADAAKNPQAGSTVVYFEVDDLEGARDSLLAAGYDPHRGPLETDDGRVVCRLRDPFGTIWGLNGPTAESG